MSDSAKRHLHRSFRFVYVTDDAIGLHEVIVGSKDTN